MGALSVLTENTPSPVGRVVRGPCKKREAQFHSHNIRPSLMNMAYDRESRMSPCQWEVREHIDRKAHWCSVLKAILQGLPNTWHRTAAMVVITRDAGGWGMKRAASAVTPATGTEDRRWHHNQITGGHRPTRLAQAQGLVVDCW